MAYTAKCEKESCQQVLFDVPDFEAISGKRPINLICRHCGTEYLVIHKGADILYRVKGQPATENIKAEHYG